jgi:putative spermidine/putrescine transport system substrate-binding protein
MVHTGDVAVAGRVGSTAFRLLCGIVVYTTLALALDGVAETQSLSGQTMRLYTYGGTYLDALREIVIKPFESETGVKVTVDDSCCTKIGAAMAAGEFIGDVVLGEDQGNLLNYQKLGWLVADKRLEEAAAASGASEALRSPRMLLLYIYAYIMAGSDPNAPMPKSWAEFWDTEKFPGTRGLIRGEPSPQLEAALLAADVPPAMLYPLDVEKAFAELDALRKKTKVLFAATGAEQINFLATGETRYSIVFSNRVVLAANEGIKLGYSYAQSLQMANGGAILKGVKNLEPAVAFLQYHYRPDVLARFAERTGLAPSYAKSAAMVSEARRPLMPTTPENSSSAVLINVEYWGENRDKLHEKWVQWLAQ